MFKPFIAGCTALLLLSACSAKSPDASTKDANGDVTSSETAGLIEGSIGWAVAGAWRSDEEKMRDASRHPMETLEFFGIQPDDTVVEIWPGGGWYTNILAPYLAQGGGTLIAAGFDAENAEGDRRTRLEQGLASFKDAHSDPVFGSIKYTAFSGKSGDLAAPGSADAVLTFRNIHNWMSGGYTEKFFTDAFKALKPGGVLGVVEHRLPSTADQDPTASSGYVHEDYVKALAEEAGFEFVSSSEINANRADTADHPFGVWTLPPNSRDKDSDGNTPADFDAEKYKAIGESDRMTLKFIKPN